MGKTYRAWNPQTRGAAGAGTHALPEGYALDKGFKRKAKHAKDWSEDEELYEDDLEMTDEEYSDMLNDDLSDPIEEEVGLEDYNDGL